MGNKMRGRYIGDKKLELIHDDSGTKIFTAAPKDNNGDGSSFSPTDLFSVSLGACILTIVGILAERDGVNIEGSHFEVEKQMSQSPRRIGALNVVIHLPSALTPEQRLKFERGGATCPVHHSLHPDIATSISYLYDV